MPVTIPATPPVKMPDATPEHKPAPIPGVMSGLTQTLLELTTAQHIIRRIAIFCGVILCSYSPITAADKITVAVAANLAQTADQLAKRFQSITPHTVEFRVASTGDLFQQIRLGVPVDHFIAADRARPEQLEAENKIVPGSRKTYALGQLLWVQTQPFDASDTRMPRLPRKDEKITEFDQTGLAVNRVGVANMTFAPYGIAAKHFLDSNKINPKKLVESENVTQTWHKLMTRQVDAALVNVFQYKRFMAQSMRQGVVRNRMKPLYARAIPFFMYGAIEQQAVVIRPTVAAQRWHDFILGPEGQRILQAFGYLPAAALDQFDRAHPSSNTSSNTSPDPNPNSDQDRENAPETETNT